MKKRRIFLMTLALSLAAAVSAWAGPFETYYDYENSDGTYSYYFDEGEGVFVTMEPEWYENTLVRIEDSGVSFYHRDSYEAYAKEGLRGGWLFTIGASVNSSFQELPRYEYLGFDEDSFMNYYAQLPTDYQAYMEDEDIRAGYDALWAGVEDVIAGIRIGKGGDNNPKTEEGGPSVITSGDYEYTVNGDGETITILDYIGAEKETVEVPSEIDGYQVIGIGEQAFSYRKMQTISFPDSLRSIGQRAFEYCELAKVEIPAGVTVGTCAFGYGDSLKKVIVGPDAVIGSRAFGYCDSLKTVVCAAGSTLEADTFEYCHALEEVILCGEVTVEKDAFYDCDKMVITRVDADEFDSLANADDTSDQPGPDEGGVGGMAGNLAGGWDVKADSTVTDEAQAVFDEAMPGHEAVALLATQVVAGANYCFLSRTVPTSANERPSYQIVYIWQNPQGDVQLLEEHDITFGLSGEDTQPETEPLEEGEHYITVTGEEYVITDCPSKAKAGETVAVQTVDVADGEVVLRVNGEDSGTWQSWTTYTFTMPDEDVEVEGWISTYGYPGA